MIKLTRVFSGPDGESHFGEMEIPMAEKPGSGRQTESIKATAVCVRERNGVHEGDWHPVPMPQLVVLVEGELEVEVGDGTKHLFTAGDIFLCEDKTGKGHRVRGVNRKTVVVQLPDAGV